MNPQEAFLQLLLHSMERGVQGHLSQLQTQLLPAGGKKMEVVRIIVVVPEKMGATRHAGA